MGGECGKYGDRRKAHTIFRKVLREKGHSVDPGEFGG